eukprot:8242214-Pyramimonas_sp.AAC.1
MRGGDNYNVNCWLQNGRAKNRYASFLITVVTCLEAVYGYEGASAYFRAHLRQPPPPELIQPR